MAVLSLSNKTLCSYMNAFDSFFKSAWHPRKGFIPIAITLLGIVILIRELQLRKVTFSIIVTLFGMLTQVRISQNAKAPFPMVVTLSGILMLLRELQYAYLQPIITQYFIDNKSEIWLLFLIAHSKR